MTTTTGPTVQQWIDRHLAALVALCGGLNTRRITGQQLTPRELEILTLRVSTPLTMRQIGKRMFLSEDAVKAAAQVGRRKLGVEHPGQLPAALANAGGGS